MSLSGRPGIIIKTITTVLTQQQEIFEIGESLPDRIVGLSKSYIKPVVRNKEVKPVEFETKVNMIKFGEINLIEHISVSALLEGIRIKKSVRYAC